MKSSLCLLHVFLLVTLLPGVTGVLRAEDTNWPRLRGPNGDGIATGAGIPTEWSDTKNLAWKTALPGPGSSSPVIWGDRVFVTCWSGYGDSESATDMSKLKRHLVCVSRADGKVLWDATVPGSQDEDPYQGMLREHGYASSTPVTDGEHVYVFFGKSGAVAFDFDGKQLWQTDLGHGSSRQRWGSGASPILYNDTLVVNASEESRAIVGLDKKTGSVLWRAEGDVLQLAYSTPVMLKGGADTPDLVVAVPGELWGLNPATGKLRWYAQHELTGNISPAVVVGDGAMYVFGGYPRTGSVAFKMGGKGDLSSTNLLWTTNTSSYVPTPVFYKGHLYVVNDQGFAICIDAKTGADVYRERAVEGAARGRGKPFYASPILVGDRLICVSRKGGTVVVAAQPEFKLLGTNVFASDDSQFNATPAAAGSQLFLRSDKFLYCVSAGK